VSKTHGVRDALIATLVSKWQVNREPRSSMKRGGIRAPPPFGPPHRWRLPSHHLYFEPQGETMSVAATETEAKHEQAKQEEPEALVGLSDKAAEKVKEIRAEESIEDSYALRLKVQGGGCSGFSYDLYFDQPQATDRPFDVKGVKLICDEMSLMYLVGTEIDYVEGLHGA